ncbi:MAG TPA: helicase C-terminal domain-containing protein [Thermoanaerobaculia bacterium]|nr:helicase C-terminal domain-containing protein [Thermoanaerobaculia bacterium]
MAPRFDFDRLAIDLAVADLLDQRLTRSIGFAQRGGYERLWLGQAIHSRYQEQALAGDPTYQREVGLSYSFQHRGWEIRVSGRADGLRRDQSGARVVEEIKSVRRGGELSAVVREIYQQQALLYAWMLSRRDGVEVGAELVLIEIGSDAALRIPLAVDLAALDGEVARRLNALIRTAEATMRSRLARREAGERLAFPYPELRPGQGEIVAAVETALAHGEHVLIEAPTGIGKTVAALYPSLAWCLREGKRLFVLTAKTLQQEMAVKVLGLLDVEGAFQGLRLRAKAKMCANDQVLCHEEYCRFAKDYALKLHTSGLVPRLLDEHAGLDPDVLFARAREAEVCPFEVSLELVGHCDVTICDYNYAFDPYVALADFSSDADLEDVVLVIDEIHNLVDRGRGYYSPMLSSLAARRAAEAMNLSTLPSGGQVAALAERVARCIEGAVDEALTEALLDGQGEPRALPGSFPEDELWRLRPAFDQAFVDYLEHRRETRSFRAEDPFVDFYFLLLRFLNGLLVSDASFSHVLERDGEDRRLKILCRDPSRFLGAVLRRAHSVVGLSATLSPPEFYRDLLGFEAGRTAAVSVPSPFPQEHRRVVIDPAVGTRWAEREANYGRIAERLAAFAEAVPGNCLALFPSYAFLAEVATRLEIPTKRLLLQQRSDSDRAREEILEHLRRAVLGDVLLLAVAGGVFAEGVDYPGEMLRGVAIVGPCLPALSLEQQLLREYYDERFERGFEYAFVVPGMTRVVQAAGRLIRSPEDRGVIALFDRRFLTRPYADHLPADWVPEEGLRALTGHPGRAAEEFFRLLR